MIIGYIKDYIVFQVADISCTSYPDECCDETSAKELAASRVLEALKAKTFRQKPLPLSNEQDVCTRVMEMVRRHYHGLWDRQLMDEYEETYNEQLPANWREVVDMLDCIAIMPLMDRVVLCYCQPGEVRTVYKTGHGLYPGLRVKLQNNPDGKLKLTGIRNI